MTAMRETIITLINHEQGRPTDAEELKRAVSHAASVLMQVENLLAQKGRHNTEIAYIGMANAAGGK